MSCFSISSIYWVSIDYGQAWIWIMSRLWFISFLRNVCYWLLFMSSLVHSISLYQVLTWAFSLCWAIAKLKLVVLSSLIDRLSLPFFMLLSLLFEIDVNGIVCSQMCWWDEVPVKSCASLASMMHFRHYVFLCCTLFHHTWKFPIWQSKYSRSLCIYYTQGEWFVL